LFLVRSTRTTLPASSSSQLTEDHRLALGDGFSDPDNAVFIKSLGSILCDVPWIRHPKFVQRGKRVFAEVEFFDGHVPARHLLRGALGDHLGVSMRSALVWQVRRDQIAAYRERSILAECAVGDNLAFPDLVADLDSRGVMEIRLGLRREVIVNSVLDDFPVG